MMSSSCWDTLWWRAVIAGQPSFSPLVPIYLPFALARRFASAVDVVQKEAEKPRHKGPTFIRIFIQGPQTNKQTKQSLWNNMLQCKCRPLKSALVKWIEQQLNVRENVESRHQEFVVCEVVRPQLFFKGKTNIFCYSRSEKAFGGCDLFYVSFFKWKGQKINTYKSPVWTRIAFFFYFNTNLNNLLYFFGLKFKQRKFYKSRDNTPSLIRYCSKSFSAKPRQDLCQNSSDSPKTWESPVRVETSKTSNAPWAFRKPPTTTQHVDTCSVSAVTVDARMTGNSQKPHSDAAKVSLFI